MATDRNMLTVVVIVTGLVSFCVGCYITPCIVGGKRAGHVVEFGGETLRQCPSCGPRGLGQCISKDICCGPTIGCYIGSVETKPCQFEDQNPTLCHVYGRQCQGIVSDYGGGSVSRSRCLARNICCSHIGCGFDSSCELT